MKENEGSRRKKENAEKKVEHGDNSRNDSLTMTKTMIRITKEEKTKKHKITTINK